MSTFMAKAETISRKWYVIDAAGKTLGETAVKAATILRGKHRPEFTPHVDCGEYVIIINAAKAVLTGKKLDQKKYYHHSGYIAGLKTEIIVNVLAVYGDNTGTGIKTNACNGLLSSARAIEIRLNTGIHSSLLLP